MFMVYISNLVYNQFRNANVLIIDKENFFDFALKNVKVTL